MTSELFQICDCEQNSDHSGHDLLTRAELEECDELTDLLSDLSLGRENYRWFMDTFFNQVTNIKLHFSYKRLGESALKHGEDRVKLYTPKSDKMYNFS